ncbi:MAG: hypothetical protein IKO64_06070 [Kiritimatiellae bacterium]|nr:hypothetical protein [Kiritimatiellia bacterium]
MEVDIAYSLIARAIDQGRVPPAYLIVGDVRGNAEELALRIVNRLFTGCAAQIEHRTHPDIVFLEPEGKARIIKVDSVRDRLVAPLGDTSFSGGWKVGVIYGADRMKAEAANAFLKTLEEPTPHTLFLLLTDAPESILPTIKSRTQQICLEITGDYLGRDDVADIREAVKAKDVGRLSRIYASLKEDAADEDLPIVRKAFFASVMAQMRQWMVSGALPYCQAFRNIDAVETAYRQSDRNLNDEAVISQLVDRIVCG